jgi:hypothetical protein
VKLANYMAEPGGLIHLWRGLARQRYDATIERVAPKIRISPELVLEIFQENAAFLIGVVESTALID